MNWRTPDSQKRNASDGIAKTATAAGIESQVQTTSATCQRVIRKSSNASSHKSQSSCIGGMRRLSPAGFAYTPGRHAFQEEHQQCVMKEDICVVEQRQSAEPDVKNRQEWRASRTHVRQELVQCGDQSRQSCKQSTDNRKQNGRHREQAEHPEEQQQEDVGGDINYMDTRSTNTDRTGADSTKVNSMSSVTTSAIQSTESGATHTLGKRPPLVVPPLPRVLNRPYPFEKRVQKPVKNTRDSALEGQLGLQPRPPRPKLTISTPPVAEPRKPMVSPASPPPNHQEYQRQDLPSEGSEPPFLDPSSKPNGSKARPHPHPRHLALRGRRVATIGKEGVGISEPSQAKGEKSDEHTIPDSTEDDSNNVDLGGVVLPRYLRGSGNATSKDSAHATSRENIAHVSSTSGLRNLENRVRSRSFSSEDMSAAPALEQNRFFSRGRKGTKLRGVSGASTGSTRSMSLSSSFWGVTGGGHRDDSTDQGNGSMLTGARATSRARRANGVARMCAVFSVKWIRRGGSKQNQRHCQPDQRQRDMRTPNSLSDNNGARDMTLDEEIKQSGRRVFDDEGIHLAVMAENCGRRISNRRGMESNHLMSGSRDNQDEIIADRRSKANATSAGEGGGGKTSKAKKPSTVAVVAAPSAGSSSGFQNWLDTDDGNNHEASTLSIWKN